MKDDDNQYDGPLPDVSLDTETDDSYDVGYKKPPKKNQFKKGRSGNPKGRPRKKPPEEEMVKLLIPRKVMADVLSAKMTVRTEDGIKEISKLEALYTKYMNDALKGDKHAQRQLNKLLKEHGLMDIKEPSPKKGRGFLLVRHANLPEGEYKEDLRRRGHIFPEDDQELPDKPDDDKLNE